MQKYNSTNNSGKIELDLLITNDCNLNCKHCLYTGKTQNKTIMSYNRLFKEINSQNTEVHLLGGEPLVHPNIEEIVRNAAYYNLNPKILTNGFKLDYELLSKLKCAGLSEIGFSIDGTKEAHESNRGRNTFDKVMKGIDYANNLGFNVKISTAVYNGNKHTISDLMVLLDSKGVKRVLLEHVLPIGRGKQLEGQNLTPHEWGLLISELRQTKKENNLKLRIAIQKVFTSNKEASSIEDFCHCINGKMPVIDWNGNYYPCIIFFAANYSFGNIDKENWQTLNNPELIIKRIKDINTAFEFGNSNLKILCPAIKILIENKELSLKKIEKYHTTIGCFHDVIII